MQFMTAERCIGIDDHGCPYNATASESPETHGFGRARHERYHCQRCYEVYCQRYKRAQ